MIRRCEGPAGEPGFKWVDDAGESECFWYDPEDPMSKLRACVGVTSAAEAAVGEQRPAS